MTELSQAQSAAANAIDVATAKLLSTHDAHFQQVVQSQESILKQLELLSSELAAAQKDAPHVKGGDGFPEVGLYVRRIEELRRRILNVGGVLSTVNQKMDNLCIALTPHNTPHDTRVVVPLSSVTAETTPTAAATTVST